MNRDLRVLAIILSPISPRFERLFWRPEISNLEGYFGFWARNFWKHVQNIPNILWIVIYAFSRSFWAQSRLYLRGFLTAQNWLLRKPVWVFGQKRWKSCTNHGKYCMNRDVRVAAIILSPNSTRVERIFWRPKIGSLQGHFWFLAQNAGNHVQIMAICCKNRVLRVAAIILRPNLTRFERIFWRPKICSLKGHFRFLAQNAGNQVQNIAYIVWIVIYACVAIILSPNSRLFERLISRPKIISERHVGFLARNVGNHVQNIADIVWIVMNAFSRSFWAKTRLDLRLCFDGQKWAPWRAILSFWPETLKIMYKTLLILYESWSTRSRDHFEPKLASIGKTFLTAQNFLLGGRFWVFGPKRWKSCTKHC